MSNILVVDDDELYGELTVQRLTLAGHDVDFQHGPFGSTLHAARRGDFDLIIVDVNMPGLSGTGLLDLINKGGKKCRVILCSSMDESVLAELARRHGADGYFSKTITNDRLTALVDRICKAPSRTSTA